MKIKRAAKYGFCAGVRIADRKVRRFAELSAGDGRILGQVVHNERVVAELEDLGVPTVDSIDEANGGTIVFSAHGVPPSFHHRARDKGLKVLDTTCPFVYDIHDEADGAVAAGAHLVFIGDPDHREVRGYTDDRDPASYHVLMTVAEAELIDWSLYPKVKILFQTTLNAEEYDEVVDYLEDRVAEVSRADTICYATKENQDAARELVNDDEVELILVIGGKQSANTRHLWEICREHKSSHWIQGAADLRHRWFVGVEGVGLTAGASTPDVLVDEVEAEIHRLASGG